MISSVGEFAARNAIEYNLQTRIAFTVFTVANAVKKFFKEPIWWYGILASGAVGFPQLSPITPIGAVANLNLTSECVARESLFGGSTAPFGTRLKDGIWNI